MNVIKISGVRYRLRTGFVNTFGTSNGLLSCADEDNIKKGLLKN
jgi:hypothetical protein